MRNWWMIRERNCNEIIFNWFLNGIAAINGSILGDPENYLTKDEMEKYARKNYPLMKEKRLWMLIDQVWTFSREIEKGDMVIVYLNRRKEYHVGTVLSNHFVHKDPEYPGQYNTINVLWEEKVIMREELSQKARDELNSNHNLFNLIHCVGEIEKLIFFPELKINSKEDEETIEVLRGKISNRIHHLLEKLDPWEFQKIVGGIFQAKGYFVIVNAKGPDGGVDVLAYHDEFQFSKTAIKVQVKKRQSKTSSSEVQQLIGASPIEGSCAVVSTGGFSSDAKVVAAQNGVKLIDGEELIELIDQYYANFPNEIKEMLTLRKIYVPEN